MKTVYGPVASWRFGKSLGIDPVCSRTCSFDCIYCQLGRTFDKTIKRKKFVSEKTVQNELKQALQKTTPDIITFSGTGEPTLALNLGKIAECVKKNSMLPTAILTNSSLLCQSAVRKDLCKFDVVCAKLDACNEKLFQEINNPVEGVNFENILSGIKIFRKKFSGKLALQMMFIKQNKSKSKEMASIAREIKPTEVQLNTPLRRCQIKPLSKKEMDCIKAEFFDLNAISVYNSKKFVAKALDLRETIQRRPFEADYT